MIYYNWGGGALSSQACIEIAGFIVGYREFVKQLVEDLADQGIETSHAIRFFDDQASMRLVELAKTVRVNKDQELQAIRNISESLLQLANRSRSIETREAWVVELVEQFTEALDELGVTARIEKYHFASFQREPRLEEIPNVYVFAGIPVWHSVGARPPRQRGEAIAA